MKKSEQVDWMWRVFERHFRAPSEAVSMVLPVAYVEGRGTLTITRKEWETEGTYERQTTLIEHRWSQLFEDIRRKGRE